MGNIKSDLFHLISLFLADAKYAEALENEKDPLWSLASLGEPEITRLLISTTAIGRVIDDRESFLLSKTSNYCGSIEVDGTSSPLNLREAFNKIIHADSFSLVISDNSAQFEHLSPEIILHGKQRSKEWNAHLDIVKYVREYSRHLIGLSKDETFT
ncbi:hypothetical protein EK599_10445 [Vibrio sp. T187]|uniref:hypothetical protein n=1 Tax=Vibrio TaxID=662 RepID=UPI0010CA16BA|nr:MULTISPECIES: hypothetical protein [Vibrio]MBW3696118.1 hypothetical protein [Vibrio sp. T187]